MAQRNGAEGAGQRDWSHILGVGWLCISLLVLGSLVSFRTADLPFNSLPHNEVPRNFIGIFGAWLGYFCFLLAGALAFLIPALLGGYALSHYFPQFQVPFRNRRCRWILISMLLACSGLMDLITDRLQLRLTVAPFGAGGLVGDLINNWILSPLFHWSGALTIYLGVYAAGAVMIARVDMAGLLRQAPSKLAALPGLLVRTGRGLLSAPSRLAGALVHRLDRSYSPEERELMRRKRQLEREARRLGMDIAPLRDNAFQAPPEPEIRDHSRPVRPARPAPPPPPPPALRPRPRPLAAREPDPPEAPEPVITLPSQDAGPAPQPPISVARPPRVGVDYSLPGVDMLDMADRTGVPAESREDLMANARLLQDTLGQFGIQVALGDITKGPTITRYELLPARNVKLEKISGLGRNIAAALKAEHINILTPVPGKGTVGIEIPNRYKTKVVIRDLLESPEWSQADARLPLVLGKDVYGKPMVVDLADMPHLLIAGSTGSGKSVCINAIIASLLFRYSPEELRFVMIDPKVVELQQYNKLPHLVVPVVTDPAKVVLALRWVVNEMEKRYQIFSRVGVRNIGSFNQREIVEEEIGACGSPDPGGEDPEEIAIPREEAIEIPERLSHIVVIIDELADLMLVAPKDVETAIARITQMARAAGIHCIVATQRPSVDVITGVIKSNIPARIAFQVASKIDSRTILDNMGAEKLLGKGDMFYLPPGSAKLVRAQGVLITDAEIQSMVDHICRQAEPSYEAEIHSKLSRPAQSAPEAESEEDEELLEQCIEVIRTHQKASVSFLQRRLRIGYTRAARVMDELENRGVVGPGRGAEPREILVDLDRDEGLGA